MDFISHGLWGATILRKKKYVWWAFLFGALPDLLGTGTAFIAMLAQHGLTPVITGNWWPLLPEWGRVMYGLSHSLVLVFLIFIILFIFVRKYIILVIPYILHLAMDLPLHVSDPLRRSFYPFIAQDPSRTFGINWWEYPWIWRINIILLIGINLFLFLRRRKMRNKELTTAN